MSEQIKPQEDQVANNETDDWLENIDTQKDEMEL